MLAIIIFYLPLLLLHSPTLSPPFLSSAHLLYLPHPISPIPQSICLSFQLLHLHLQIVLSVQFALTFIDSHRFGRPLHGECFFL